MKLRELLSRMPRVSLGTYPTPLHDLPRLTALLGGPRLLIKRDDMTGLAFGGNKPRSLEFLMADALAQGADTIISSASAQSNMLRTTAAAARRLGLDVHLVLRGSGDEPLQGNLLIDRLLGAEMTFIRTTDPYSKLSVEVMQRIALDLQTRGRKPYIIDVRSHSGALSILGYIWAATELQDQIGALGLTRPIVACAVSSGTTLAGLLLGTTLMGSPFRVLGLCVQKPASFMLPNLLEKVSSAASLLGQDLQLTPGDVALDDRWIGPAYAVLTPECVDAMKQIARAEGILVDPVYSSKALAGILGRIGEGSLTSDDTVVFLHTGGTPAIFAYAEQLARIIHEEHVNNPGLPD